VCTVVGTTVTLVTAGTCSITASQTGNAYYAAASPVVQSFQVMPASQTISFAALSNQPFGTAPFAVGATASSGLAVSFASTTSGVCTVSAATVTLVSAGTCTIQATQAGNTSYAAAPSVSQSFQVLAPQTITFTALPNQFLGAGPFTVNAIASSGLTVSFNSQTTAVCTVAGSTVTLVSAGNCDIQATQSGDATFAAAPSVSESFQVLPGTQIITFGSLSSQLLGAAPFTVSASSSSGLAVSFASAAPAVCTVTGAAVTVVSAGACTIQASQPGNANWVAAMPVNQSFPVLPALGASALLVGSTAGTSSVLLSYGGAWTAGSNSSFLHISPASTGGTASSVVIFTYDAFSGTGSRSGTLTIAGFTVTVTQAGTNYIAPGPVTTLVSSGLAEPEGIAVDGSGNVYIADRVNSAVREWNASTQQMTTLVGTGLSYPDAVAVDGSGNVYIADTGNNTIKEWSASTQQVTALVPTGLSGPTGVAVDGSGNVYIADTGNSAIKEWSPSTQQVTALVSTGLSGPTGVAVDGSGNVYIGDTGNNAVKQWNAATQQVTTLVSTGLNGPTEVAVDGSGNVYIADTGNHAIEEWSASTQQVAAVVSTGAGDPGGIAVDGSGNVYFSDSLANVVEEMPFAFVGPANLTEPYSAGSDALLTVLPSTASLAGVFAPTSDQSWLTIGSIAEGVINFSFAANPTSSVRTAHLTVLGQPIAVTQSTSGASLTVTETHAGNFVQGQNGATYTITAANNGSGPTYGTVTVTDTLPTWLTVTALGGTGWNCTMSTVTCTRSDALNAGVGYPVITLTVNVNSAAPSTVTNQVTVSGGSSASANASDDAKVFSPCDLYQTGSITVADVQLMINQALGVAPVTMDLDGDGVVNVVDVQIVINAALGLGCVVK